MISDYVTSCGLPNRVLKTVSNLFHAAGHFPNGLSISNVFIVNFEHMYLINPFHATDLFLYPLKTSDTLCFSDVFRGYSMDRNNDLVSDQTYCSRTTLSPWGATMVVAEGKILKFYVSRLSENAFSRLNFN